MRISMMMRMRMQWMRTRMLLDECGVQIHMRNEGGLAMRGEKARDL